MDPNIRFMHFKRQLFFADNAKGNDHTDDLCKYSCKSSS